MGVTPTTARMADLGRGTVCMLRSAPGEVGLMLASLAAAMIIPGRGVRDEWVGWRAQLLIWGGR